LRNTSVRFYSGVPTSKYDLKDLDISQYDHIAVLSDLTIKDPAQADSKNLIILLHARNIIRGRDGKVTIVSQILDARN
jgi:hypothetical protein